jgi:hypothetical protein
VFRAAKVLRIFLVRGAFIFCLQSGVTLLEKAHISKVQFLLWDAYATIGCEASEIKLL